MRGHEKILGYNRKALSASHHLGLLNFNASMEFFYLGIKFKIPVYPEGVKYMICEYCASKAKDALNKGILIEQPCEICGTKENIIKHHEDYNKPLEVRWLCKRHHFDIHSIIHKLKRHKYSLELF